MNLFDILLKMSSGTPLSSAEKQSFDDFMGELKTTKTLVDGVFKGTNTITQVSQITNDLGDQIAGRFIAPQTTTIEPTDTGFTGSFMSAFGETFGSDTFNVGAVAAGVLQAGFNTLGKFIAAAGLITLDIDGITITAKNFDEGFSPLKWKRDDDSEEIAYAFGNYVPSVASGLSLYGRGSDSSHYGFAQLVTMNETDVLADGDFRTALTLDAQGNLVINLDNGSNTATGSKATGVRTSYSTANALQNLLYLDLRTSGTAAAGLGPAIAFRGENANGDLENMGYLALKYNATTDGSEDVIPLVGITELGSSNEYQLANPRMLSADNARTSISTSGETTIFSESLVGSFFAADRFHLTGETMIQVDTNASGRNLTLRFALGSTTVTTTIALAANSVYRLHVQIWANRQGSNTQDTFVNVKNWNVTAGGLAAAQNIDQGSPGETETGAITASLTAQLSGSVDSGYFCGHHLMAFRDA